MEKRHRSFSFLLKVLRTPGRRAARGSTMVTRTSSVGCPIEAGFSQGVTARFLDRSHPYLVQKSRNASYFGGIKQMQMYGNFQLNFPYNNVLFGLVSDFMTPVVARCS